MEGENDLIGALESEDEERNEMYSDEESEDEEEPSDSWATRLPKRVWSDDEPGQDFRTADWPPVPEATQGPCSDCLHDTGGSRDDLASTVYAVRVL